MNIKKTLFIFLFTTIITNTMTKNIVFDLEGVIFIPPKKRIVLNHLGILDTLLYMVTYRKTPSDLEKQLFEIMSAKNQYPDKFIVRALEQRYGCIQEITASAVPLP